MAFMMRNSSLYFNPVFIVLNYRFYNIEIESKKRLFVISKRYFSPYDLDNIKLNKIIKINDMTYLDMLEEEKR